MLRKLVLLLALMIASGLFAQTTNIAHACPMCQVATEADAHLPRAYMYSILFMLAMPATMFAGFGIGLYRLNRKENAGLPALEQFARDAADDANLREE